MCVEEGAFCSYVGDSEIVGPDQVDAGRLNLPCIRVIFVDASGKDCYLSGREPFQLYCNVLSENIFVGFLVLYVYEFRLFSLRVEPVHSLAEIGWTRPEDKDWARFGKSVDAFSERLPGLGIIPARSMFNIQHKVVPENGRLKVMLECERTDVQIRYTLDGSEPCARSPLYRRPLEISGDANVMAATFRDGEMLGKILSLPLGWNKATACSFVYGGDQVLVNGVRGSLRRSDFEWAAAADIDSLCIDLGRVTDLENVILGAVNDFGMAVHLPRKVEVSLSADGKSFDKVGEWIIADNQVFAKGTFVIDTGVSLERPAAARYVSVKVTGQGRTPALHCRPASESRMYFDEIIVQ